MLCHSQQREGESILARSGLLDQEPKSVEVVLEAAGHKDCHEM